MNDRATLLTCVLGMHRSGTSVVSRLVNLLGVNLGPEAALTAPAADNPKGYWEHQGLTQINEEILQLFGGRWSEMPQWPSSWVGDERLGDLRERARRLLATDFPPDGPRGWKDPRTCLTLPFWLDIVGRMQFVLAVRTPCAVIASLRERNGMDREQAESLWLHHVSASLEHTAGERRLFIFYDDILRDLPRELTRLAAFLDAPERAADPAIVAAASAFLDADLRHHHMSPEDVAADPQLSSATKSLYAAIRELATAGS